MLLAPLQFLNNVFDLTFTLATFTKHLLNVSKLQMPRLYLF